MIKLQRQTFILITHLFVLQLLSFSAYANTQSVADYGATGEGSMNDTVAVQKAVNSGASVVQFPKGKYRLGTVQIPGDVTIQFERGATVMPDIEKLGNKPVFVLNGNNIVLDGAHFNLTDMKDVATKGMGSMHAMDKRPIISAEGVSHIRLTNLSAVGPEPETKPQPPHGWAGVAQIALVRLQQCQDIEVDHCRTTNIGDLVDAAYTHDLTVHDNRAENGYHMTAFQNGSQYLKHYNNWSRNIRHQCQWWGGDSNDQKKTVPSNTAWMVKRGLAPGMKEFNKDLAGAYDIQVANNYAEYGQTLTWGSKGRDILISGNVARFMTDMAYDTEGGANVVIANNISINSKYYGIGCYFWSERAVITGNLVLVLPIGLDEYKGQFLRLHGPGSADHFGSGEILITGNLFSNQTGGNARLLKIEACRDATISSNKFVNGTVTTRINSRRINIINNEFQDKSEEGQACLRIGAGTDAILIRNNVFTRLVKNDSTVAKNPALQLAMSEGRLRVIENNFISGWPTSVNCQIKSPNQNPGKLIVRHNTVSGDLCITAAQDDAYQLFEDGNLDAKSLKIIKMKHNQ